MVVAEDTDAGRNLAGLIKAGYTPGYSLRGAGDTIELPTGYEEIDPDYVLITVDVVGNPSFDNKALITSHFESDAGKKKAHKILTESINRYGKEVALNYSLRNKNFLTDRYHCYNREALLNNLRG